MARARTFDDLVDLLQRAEDRLERTGGIGDPEQRLIALRGIYYGTAWSLDFRAERSQWRNRGFTIFTGFGTPPDPRPALGTLFTDLQASQDIRDGGHAVDVGHALIGMESHTNAGARTVPIPSQGGTGLEIVTWLGDLGGGAANLTWRRAAGGAAAGRSVSTVFSATGSDYGASINLEGDIAGYLIGSGASLAAPTFPRGSGVADLFADYLPIGRLSRIQHARRCRDFLTILGGRLAAPPATRLSNRSAVVRSLATKIHDFAAAYMLQRYIVGQGQDRSRVERACRLLAGTATEVATAFVLALEHGVRSTRTAVRGRPPWPAASHPGTCTSRALQIAARERDVSDTIERGVREGRRGAAGWLRELESLF